MFDAADLPLIAAQAREAAKDVAIARNDEHIARNNERIERLEKLVAAFKQPLGANPRRPIPTNSTWR